MHHKHSYAQLSQPADRNHSGNSSFQKARSLAASVEFPMFFLRRRDLIFYRFKTMARSRQCCDQYGSKNVPNPCPDDPATRNVVNFEYYEYLFKTLRQYQSKLSTLTGATLSSTEDQQLFATTWAFQRLICEDHLGRFLFCVPPQDKQLG